MKICLSVLMGLPGSGKTTFAKALKQTDKFVGREPCHFIHVCYDDLISYVDFHKYEEGNTTWKEMREDVLNQVELLIASLTTNSLDKCPVNFRNQVALNITESAVVIIVIDDNMYLRSMRYTLFKKAKEYKISFCQVYLKCSVEVAVERNMLRSSDQIVPINVIHGMHGKFEEPRTDNKWERYSLVVDTLNDVNEQLSEYYNLLNMSLNDPVCMEDDNVEEKQKDAMICMTSLLHQSDIALRQMISKKIQNYLMNNKSRDNKKEELKNYSTELSFKKVQILNGIKSGLITVPENVLLEIKEDKVSDKKYLRSFLDNFLTAA